MIKKTILNLTVFTLLSSSAMAGSEMFSEYAVSVKGGTLGAGLEVITPLTESINLRTGINGFTYGMEGTEEEIDYEYDLKLLTVNLLADWYMIDNSQFRLTGGVMYNGNKLEMTGKANQNATFTINDVVYNTSDVSGIDVDVDFNKVAPYIGIGWGNAVKSAGWNFTADAGVMFQGSASADITANCTANAATCSQVQANVDVEESQLEDDLSGYKYYPVLSVGVSYRF